jgi:pyruvate dehydrogenase phosphatase
MLRPAARALSHTHNIRLLMTKSGYRPTAARLSWPKAVSAVAFTMAIGVYFGHHPGVLNDSTPSSSGTVQSIRPQSTKQSIKMLSPAQVTSWLRENEESYFVDRGRGVVRYDISQLPSNSPIEDDRSEQVIQVPLLTETGERIASDWSFWGLYDGHSGWTTSAKLRDALIPSVIGELDKVYVKSSPGSIHRLVPEPEVIDRAVKNGFLKLDNEIVNESVVKLLENPSKAGATELIAPALSGSCGILAFYDSSSSLLRIAVTGDSRAVLGSKNESGQWTARALSTDQTGSNIDEANRLRKEHPGEESTVVRAGRVLGSLEPTRAFGDARFKWSRNIQHKIAQMFFGRQTPHELKTPPYVTAEPEVTTTKINPERGDFLVLGSDGVFEMLTNEELVGLVAQWIEIKMPDNSSMAIKSHDSPGVFQKLFGLSKKERSTVEDVSSNKDAQKQVIRRAAGAHPAFTVQDENVATHIIRNALGGADQEQVSMLISIPAPLSRRYRDDLTVTVVFFGDLEAHENGSIKVNKAATKSQLRKAKL